MEIWTIWWVWVVAGVVLAVLEIVIPGFIFLGFALGAGLTGLLVLIGVAPGNVALLALLFAVLSLAAWVGLRRLVGVTRTQVKVWKDDINDQ
jgi:membrane protein implicated in regulation of membrane protease activity